MKENTTGLSSKGLQNKPQQATKLVKGLVVNQDWKIGADTLNIILYQRQVSKTAKPSPGAHK